MMFHSNSNRDIPGGQPTRVVAPGFSDVSKQCALNWRLANSKVGFAANSKLRCVPATRLLGQRIPGASAPTRPSRRSRLTSGNSLTGVPIQSAPSPSAPGPVAAVAARRWSSCLSRPSMRATSAHRDRARARPAQRMLLAPFRWHRNSPQRQTNSVAQQITTGIEFQGRGQRGAYPAVLPIFYLQPSSD